MGFLKNKKLIRIATILTAVVIVIFIAIVPLTRGIMAAFSVKKGDFNSMVANANLTSVNFLGNAIKKPIIRGTLKDIQVGSTIVFGSYDQDNNPENGAEEIEWIVLDKDKNKVFVVSKYALAMKQYTKFNKEANLCWESSFARKWLNDKFLNEAFNEKERNNIAETLVKNNPNPLYGTNCGDDTYDRIFLLSIEEVETYMENNEDRICKATETAKQQGSTVYKGEYASWLLRTMGRSKIYVTNVHGNGTILKHGTPPVDNGYSIRPAMWIEI